MGAGFLNSPASAQMEKTQVVVMAKSDIAKGRVLVASLLLEKEIEARLAPINGVAGIAECVGRTIKKEKKKGQIILIDDLENP